MSAAKSADVEPWFPEDILAGVRDYWRVFDGQLEAVEATLRPLFLQRLSHGPAFAGRIREALELPRRAILQAAWSPYERRLREDGVRYARRGVPFREWVEMVSLVAEEMAPRLMAAYGEEPARLAGAMRGMQRLLSRALSVVGEEYVATRAAVLQQSAVVEASSDAIIGQTLDDTITSWNKGAEQLFGYSAEELLGQPGAVLVPSGRTGEERAILDRLRRGETLQQHETLRRRKDGSEIEVSVTYSPIRSPDGEVVGVSKVARDVSELHRAQRAIVQANRQKSEFLANMSHELRTPLNAILGFAELLYDGRVADEVKQKEFLGDILTSGRHLLRLINDVLDLSKIEAGKMVFHPEPVELANVIREVTTILAPIAAAKSIRVETSIADLGSVVIDAARLKQVLYNYLSNALKFTPPGGRVAVRIAGEGAGSFRLEVEDTGVGIAPANRDRLFTEFQQLEAGPGKGHGGTGLGLALTKRLVEAQAGVVGVEGAPGKGSRFFAVLPRRSSGATILPFKPARRAPPGAPIVLAVEDDPADQAALTEILLSAGYEVQIAANGAEAITLAGLRPYAAITLDLILPDMSGLDVLRSIRVAGPNAATPVVVATVVAENVTRALRVSECLGKPLDRDALLGALRRAGVVPGTDRCVLVVDDDPVSLKLMAETLEQMDYRPVCRSDGARGLEEAFTLQPAAVILDLVMPGVDGFEFLRRFRAQTGSRRVPVIVWSSKELTPRELDQLRASAVGLIPKSTGGSELIEELELCLWDAASLAGARTDG